MMKVAFHDVGKLAWDVGFDPKGGYVWLSIQSNESEVILHFRERGVVVRDRVRRIVTELQKLDLVEK